MTNTEIKIKTFLPDGTESGEMAMPIDSVLAMAQFSFFAKLCRESDEKAGTQAIETIKAEIMARIAELKNHETGEYKSELCKKDGEKLEKKLLAVCPELKQEERKLKTIEKNQLYFWTGKDRENNVKISAHLGDKYQLPGGYYAFIEKEQPHGISEKPKYRATDAICGMMIKKGSLKEVKEFLKLESTETALKNALESWRAKENAELIEKVKSGKIDRNEIEIMTNDENERFLIEMYLTDIYTNAKQAETAETETTENHLEESRKEESAPTEAKGEFTMNENTNAAVQATEETAEKRYTAAEIQTATGFEPENVRISAHIWHDMGGTPYNVFRAAFVAGTSYKIPAKYTKSAAAEICFTVVSNNGKSLKVNIYEKYNGKISEQMNKTKKLCPGGHGHWLVFDTVSKKFMHEWRTEEKQNTIEFFQVDTIESGNISRWTNGYISCYECIPMTETEFDNWRQNPGTATTNSAQPGRKTAEELDFAPVFYPVSEELARQHKNMISWSDYKPGTATAEYQEAVKEAYELAKKSSDPEKSLYLAECYSRRLARWYDDYNRNGAACPSVMISGAGNFPTRKKEKQNARFDTLMKQYNKIKQLLEKIEKPHGYGVEIRRDTITAEEFENILYFDTVINEEENRLQLIFDGKPEEAERNILKKNGFRWSPRFKAWQRQLTENAVAAVWDVVKQFDELEDSENAEIQAETEKIKSATPENPVETVEAEQEAQPEEIPEESAQAETTEAEQEIEKSNNIDLSLLPCLTGENIPCFVPDSYLGLYSTAQALKENTDKPENAQYFREQISRILKKYIADAENIIAVYGAEALEIFEYAEIFSSFIHGELSEEISTAKEKGLKIFAEYHTEPEQETQPQPETIPTEADTSPTDSPEAVTPETIQPHEETATETPQAAETSTAGETEAVDDWSGVEFAPLDGFPDPETVGAEPEQPPQKVAEMLTKLDRMKDKLSSAVYANKSNSRYYAGFLAAVCAIFGDILYNPDTKKHHLSDTQPEQAQSTPTPATPEHITQAEPDTQPTPTETEPLKFEPGKIYACISITNSDYIHAYKCISRTAKTVTFEDSRGNTIKKRPELMERYCNGGKKSCETVYPDGRYSMCLVLDASELVTADTPRQAEEEHFKKRQERTAAAVSAARQRQIIQTTGGAKITMSINGAAQ